MKYAVAVSKFKKSSAVRQSPGEFDSTYDRSIQQLDALNSKRNSSSKRPSTLLSKSRRGTLKPELANRLV